MLVITAKRALFLWLLAISMSVSLSAGVYFWNSGPPAPPAPCVDAAELRNINQSRFECRPGARLEVFPAGSGEILVKCVCPRPTPASPDAAAR